MSKELTEAIKRLKNISGAFVGGDYHRMVEDISLVLNRLESLESNEDKRHHISVLVDGVYYEPEMVKKLLDELDKRRELLKVAACPNSDCVNGGYHGEFGEPIQCQFCYERKQILEEGDDSR